MGILRFIFASIVLRFKNQVIFRGSFFLKFLGEIAYIVIYFLFFQIIFAHTESIGGWNKGMVFMLIGSAGIVFSIFSALANAGAASIMQLVRKGGIELMFLKPLPAPFFILFRFASIADLLGLFVPLGVFIYGLRIYGSINFISLILWIFSILISFFIYSSLHLLLGLLSFRFIRISGLYWMLGDFADLGKYPNTIFPLFLRNFLLYFLPVLMVSNFPVLIYVGRYHLLFVQIMLLALFVTLLLIFFPIARRVYQGAGTYEIGA